ncbi:Ger(x)C family spore germination C-terminal domain-containing protein [Paenibacillus macerans]|nr:Ger(x)C family spore germination C-terminal domain-containing protein [Paenibacillus macerans]
MMQATLEKVQLEYKSDVIGLGTHLKQEYTVAWKKIQNDWDCGENYFSQAEQPFLINPS